MAGGYIAQPDTINEKTAATDAAEPADHEPSADGEEPTEHEKRTLRRIGENLPAAAYLIAVVELTERFTYYGAQGLFQNYINNRPNGADGAPGLGLGNQAATGLNLFFQWFCYGKSHSTGLLRRDPMRSHVHHVPVNLLQCALRAKPCLTSRGWRK